MKNKDEQTRIAIIGAGAAGMSAAWFLKQAGYRNVRVFEKLDRVGGKCLSFEYEGRQFDMAAHEMLAGYGDVMDIARALKVPTTGYQHVLVYDRDNKRYMDMLEATQSGGYGKLQVVWASLRYTWMLLTRYRNISKPGSGLSETPAELLQPLSSWLKEQRLEALTETVLFVMKVQGFGRLDQMPAAYFVKFQGLRNWLSNVLHVAGLIQSWPRVFKHGFQSLWDAVEQEVDVQLSCDITAIHRQPAPDKNVIEVEIEFAGDGENEMFDQIILACPLDVPTLSQIGLDVTAQEKRLLEKVRYVEFVTTAWEAEGIPAGVVGTIPLPPELNYTGYIKTYDDSDMTIFFSLAPSENYDPAEIEARTRAQVAKLPDCKGKPARLIAMHSQHGWRYFPHVELADFSDGFYDQLESLQGFEHTFYDSSLLAFETVGNTVAYSRGLVNRYFPPVD
jgi:monoamine oxidase